MCALPPPRTHPFPPATAGPYVCVNHARRQVFNNHARVYRIFARVLYLLMLLAALAMTAVTTTSLVTTIYACDVTVVEEGPGLLAEYLGPEEVKIAVMVCATALVVFTATQSLFQPGVRWTQLRGAALALESEIWRFRTRTGAYGAKDSWMSSAAQDDSQA